VLVAFAQDLLVAVRAEGRYGRRHLTFYDFSGGISEMTGEAFLKFMRLHLHAVDHDADENSANQQDNDQFLPHRMMSGV
jgi:hypothetical protein